MFKKIAVLLAAATLSAPAFADRGHRGHDHHYYKKHRPVVHHYHHYRPAPPPVVHHRRESCTTTIARRRSRSWSCIATSRCCPSWSAPCSARRSCTTPSPTTKYLVAPAKAGVHFYEHGFPPSRE